MTNGKLTIEPIRTPEERLAFIHFQWQVYRDDPNWVPPLISERVEFLDKERHPFYQHAEVELFMARRDGKPVGTIAAILNNRHNEFHDEKVGFFGLFEVLHDQEAAEGLLETASEWVRQQGMTAIRGPVSFSTNEEKAPSAMTMRLAFRISSPAPERTLIMTLSERSSTSTHLVPLLTSQPALMLSSSSPASRASLSIWKP